MFPSVVWIIVHNVRADVIAILGTSILGWLSQLSDYIFIFLCHIFIYLLALFFCLYDHIMKITWQLHSSWFWSGPRTRPRLAVNVKDTKKNSNNKQRKKGKALKQKDVNDIVTKKSLICSSGKSSSAWVGEEVSPAQQELWRKWRGAKKGLAPTVVELRTAAHSEKITFWNFLRKIFI